MLPLWWRFLAPSSLTPFQKLSGERKSGQRKYDKYDKRERKNDDERKCKKNQRRPWLNFDFKTLVSAYSEIYVLDPKVTLGEAF